MLAFIHHCNSLVFMMATNLILLVAALLVSWLIFRWLFTVVKSSASTALSIAVILLILQFAFGINSQELFQEIMNLPQTLQDLFQR